MKQTTSKPKTRAEELRRQRTSQTSRKPVADAARAYEAAVHAGAATLRPAAPARRAAAAPTPSRPVTVRNVATGLPNRTVAAASPRRAYYLSLSTPGTEMRLPALPVIHFGWRLFSATIALLAIAGIFTLLFSPFFRVGPVTINGLERLTQSDVEAVLDLENLSIVEVTPQTVEKELLTRFTALENASISVGLPAGVILTVKERTPVLGWKQGDTLQWVDGKGVIFPPNGDAGELVIIPSSGPAPVVLPQAPADASQQAASADGTSADGTTDASTPESSAKLAKPVNTGPAHLEPNLFATARKLGERLPPSTPLVYTQAEGLGWEDTTGYDVYIGTDLATFDEKFNMVQSIAEQLAQKGIVPELINAENLDAPYYRAEN